MTDPNPAAIGDTIDEIMKTGTDLRATLEELKQLSDSFADSFIAGLKGVALEGRKLGDVLKSLALSFSQNLLNQALRPLQTLVSSGFSSVVGGLSAAISPQPLDFVGMLDVKPFAKGGLIAAPTYFQFGTGLGLAGEAGAEAILPLARGGDGRLGVRTLGEAAGPAVTINIATPNVESFRRSEAHLAAMLARAVGRGRRGL